MLIDCRPDTADFFFQVIPIMTDRKPVSEQVLDFFASVKLAIVLLIGLAAASVAGTIIPQNLAPQRYFQAYGRELFTFFSYLDFFDVYHSWWFNFLLGLLLLNLIVCSIKRLPRTLKLARPISGDRLGPDFLSRQPFSAEIQRSETLQNLMPEIRRIVRRGFCRPHETKTKWGALLTAHKGAFSRFGVFLIHGSIIIIAAGAVIGNFFGFEAYMNLAEGQTKREAELRRGTGAIILPFDLRLDRFVIKFYRNGAISEFRSEVSIIEKGRQVGQASIMVNHPLTYRGLTFYQSAYGQTLGQSLWLSLTRRADNKIFLM